jgi:hypothetical protein
MKRYLLTLPFLFLFLGPLSAQDEEAPRPSSYMLVYGSFGFHLPGGDLADRFGSNLLVGPGFMYKTDANWFWGIEADFLSGNSVKEDDIFAGLETETGFMIDASGLYADVYTSERGFRVGPRFGKIIPLNKKNPNAGLMFSLSPGLLQHKIRIENRNNAAPQVDPDYAKGYDRLSNGFALTEFVGYFYSGKSSLVSFYAGMEFVQAWTQSRRDWDFDKMQKDETRRQDYLNGFKAGWVIQFNRSTSRTYYY